MRRWSLAILLAGTLTTTAWLVLFHWALRTVPVSTGAGATGANPQAPLVGAAWGLALLGLLAAVVGAAIGERRRRWRRRRQVSLLTDPGTGLASFHALRDDLASDPCPTGELLVVHLRGLERQHSCLAPSEVARAIQAVGRELRGHLALPPATTIYRCGEQGLALRLAADPGDGRLAGLAEALRRCLEHGLEIVLLADDVRINRQPLRPPLELGRLLDPAREPQRPSPPSLRQALLGLRESDLQLRFQPILPLARPGHCDAELLVRFRPPLLAGLGTETVLAAALEMGLAHRIDALVLAQLPRLQRRLQASDWLAGRLDRLSVNLSSETMTDPVRLAGLIQRFRDLDLDVTRFAVEITESAATHQLHQGVNVTSASERLIKELNLRVCIDDFGSGLSNYQRISQAWYDVIKLDQALVRGIGQSFRLQRYLDAFIQSAHALGKTVVAEGVQSQEDLAAVVRLGVDGVQGFLIAPALGWPQLLEFAAGSEWLRAPALERRLEAIHLADPLGDLPPPQERDPAPRGMPLERYILNHWSSLRSFEEFVLLYAQELRSWGLELMRLSLAFLPDQADLQCSQFIWTRDRPGDVQTREMDPSFLQQQEHLGSPLHHIATHEPIYRQRLASCRDLPFAFLEELRQLGCCDYLGLRLGSRGVSVPVLTIALTGESAFGDDQIQRIRAMSDLFSLLFHAFESERARRLALIDPLTSLPNRRSFDGVLRAGVAAAAVSGKPLALALIDIDRFKAINDSMGHGYGDECLRRVARILRETANRPGDTVARLGGEEFGVILPACGDGEAQAIGERLRLAVAAAGLEHPADASDHRLTISVGLALWRPGAPCEAVQLQEEADACLYLAKRTGRNRVVSR